MKYNVILFLRNDIRCIEDIEYIYDNFNLVGVIFKDYNIDKKLLDFLHKRNIEYFSQEDFTSKLSLNNFPKVDYILSFYYQRILDQSILSIAEKACINFHPAPLPKYRGVGNYIWCILNELEQWGCTAHLMDLKIDNGGIIKTIHFNVDHENETYYSLEKKTLIYMKKLLRLICESISDFKIIDINKSDDIVITTHKKIQELKKIRDSDTAKEINKKIRAFWNPPNSGAIIKIGVDTYTIVNDYILNLIKRKED